MSELEKHQLVDAQMREMAEARDQFRKSDAPPMTKTETEQRDDVWRGQASSPIDLAAEIAQAKSHIVRLRGVEPIELVTLTMSVANRDMLVATLGRPDPLPEEKAVAWRYRYKSASDWLSWHYRDDHAPKTMDNTEVQPLYTRPDKIERLTERLSFAEFEWNRATEGMKERDAEIERLTTQLGKANKRIECLAGEVERCEHGTLLIDVAKAIRKLGRDLVESGSVAAS